MGVGMGKWIQVAVDQDYYVLSYCSNNHTTMTTHPNPHPTSSPCPNPIPSPMPQPQQQTKQSKTFLQDIFKINYINTSKIVYRLSSHCAQVKVNNYLCYQQDQNLYKVTEIVYEDRLIRIQDRFQVVAEVGDESNQGGGKEDKEGKDGRKGTRNIQKVRMFNKNLSKECRAQKKDKKNIVKNVIKIFNAWLQKKSQKLSASSTNALEQLQKLLQSQNYNNRLIKKIVESKEMSKQFMKFLQDDAEDQIKYSRIQDKESHYEALQIYYNLLANYQKQPSPIEEAFITSSREQNEKSENHRNNSKDSQHSEDMYKVAPNPTEKTKKRIKKQEYSDQPKQSRAQPKQPKPRPK